MLTVGVHREDGDVIGKQLGLAAAHVDGLTLAVGASQGAGNLGVGRGGRQAQDDLVADVDDGALVLGPMLDQD
jgi:hypothetical protein